MKVKIDLRKLYKQTSSWSSSSSSSSSSKIKKNTGYRKLRDSSAKAITDPSIIQYHKNKNSPYSKRFNSTPRKPTPFNLSVPWYSSLSNESANPSPFGDQVSTTINNNNTSTNIGSNILQPNTIIGWPTNSNTHPNLRNNSPITGTNNTSVLIKGNALTTSNSNSTATSSNNTASDETSSSNSPSMKQPTISSLAKVNTNSRHRLLTTPPSKLNSTSNYKTPRNINNSNNSNNNLSSSMRKKLNLTSSNEETNTTSNNNNKDSLNDILYIFALILKSASQFDSYKAIRLFDSKLPKQIKNNMPWCQAQLGKLHFEIVNYKTSLKYFKKLRLLQPTRIKDLETFSTLLWHLHDKTNLTDLSNILMDEFRDKPETWCAVGNLFSLQKDHDEAIRAFDKATKLDPNFVYAYTLQGHEYLSMDSYDTAKTFYRKAISNDLHHYNAYYGMGMCSMKLGEYEQALVYFEKARSINPSNAILICCCGVTMEKLGNQEKALNYYELACQIQPTSSLAKFKRAHLLYSMAKYTQALDAFEELIKIAPEEATVQFILGQLYQIMGRKKDAIKRYTIAMNLDPKGSNLISDALKKCHEQEE